MTILLYIVFLASCSNITHSDPTSSKTPSTEITTQTTTQLSKYGYGGDPDQTANGFLESLKNKDVEGFISFINWIYSDEIKNSNIQAYSFIRDINVDSYNILKKDTINDQFDSFVRFTVELHISRSGTDIFPVGISQWILDIDAPVYIFNVRSFKNVETEMNIITDKNQNDMVKFCCDFSFEMNCYSTVTDFNTLIPDSNDEAIANFYQGLIRCLPVTFDNNSAVKREEIEKLAKNVLGISGFDVRKSMDYNKNNDTIPIIFNSASWVTCSLTSKTFDLETKQYIIIIEYYSDTAYLQKAKTMQYNIGENIDKSFTLISTELLFDSGFQVASGLI